MSATIAVFLATNTGALVFFAGVVVTMLKNHEKRLDNIEAEQRAEHQLPQQGKREVGFEHF